MESHCSHLWVRGRRAAMARATEGRRSQFDLGPFRKPPYGRWSPVGLATLELAMIQQAGIARLALALAAAQLSHSQR
jgi:hypothetical protein